jgi:hypothetical protein
MPKTSYYGKGPDGYNKRSGQDYYPDRSKNLPYDPAIDKGDRYSVDYGPARLKRADVKNPKSYVADKKFPQKLPNLSKSKGRKLSPDEVGPDSMSATEWREHERLRQQRRESKGG